MPSCIFLSSMLLVAVVAAGNDHNETECLFLRSSNTVIKDRFRKSNTTADSDLDCVLSQCPCWERCAVSYHPPSGQCVAVDAALFSLVAEGSVFFDTAADDPRWTTLVTKGEVQSAADGPSALWLLDDALRGRNLGSKGERLNMSDTSLSFTGAGPPGSRASQKFARLQSRNRASVKLEHDRKVVLNLTHSFTWGLWVRADNVTAIVAIIDGVPLLKTPHLWFFPSQYQDQLLLDIKDPKIRFASTRNRTGRLGWRHIIAVYEYPDKGRFYLNGKAWSKDEIKFNLVTVQQPTDLSIGHRNGFYRFQGSMACIAIYERALTDQEAFQLMTACP